jgi:hypothetical protein
METNPKEKSIREEGLRDMRDDYWKERGRAEALELQVMVYGNMIEQLEQYNTLLANFISTNLIRKLEREQ